jgi:hypothetical protein
MDSLISERKFCSVFAVEPSLRDRCTERRSWPTTAEMCQGEEQLSERRETWTELRTCKMDQPVSKLRGVSTEQLIPVTNSLEE